MDKKIISESKESSEPYVIVAKKEEVELIMESRKYPKVSKKINENPKRFIKYINSRL